MWWDAAIRRPHGRRDQGGGVDAPPPVRAGQHNEVDDASVGGGGRDIRGAGKEMRTEELKRWLRETKREKDPVRRRWELVVRLVKVMFGDGTVPEEISSTTMVLLPNGKGGGIRALGY